MSIKVGVVFYQYDTSISDVQIPLYNCRIDMGEIWPRKQPASQVPLSNWRKNCSFNTNHRSSQGKIFMVRFSQKTSEFISERFILLAMNTWVMEFIFNNYILYQGSLSASASHCQYGDTWDMAFWCCFPSPISGVWGWKEGRELLLYYCPSFRDSARRCSGLCVIIWSIWENVVC